MVVGSGSVNVTVIVGSGSVSVVVVLVVLVVGRVVGGRVVVVVVVGGRVVVVGGRVVLVVVVGGRVLEVGGCVVLLVDVVLEVDGGRVVVVVVVPGCVVVVVEAGRKVASTMFQLVPVPRVRLPSCGPAALDRMSSRSEAELPFCTSRTYGTLLLLPGVAEPGWPPVRTAATTSSPAGTDAVGPALASVPWPCAIMV